MIKHTTNLNEMTLNDSMIIRSSFETLELSHEFRKFDYYLIEKWSGIQGKINYEELDAEEILRLRKLAYHNFNKAVSGQNIANSRTIRKWFGIDEYTPPKRDMFYKVALTLGLSVDEAKDYMVNGLMIPSFQINDYQEIIYLYGLHNRLSYAQCGDMITVFERGMGTDIEYEQDNHTEKLWKLYEVNKNMEPGEFLAWMLENKALFKGYSKTVLDYFMMLRDEIIGYIKKDALAELTSLLDTAGYAHWKNNSDRNTSDRKNIVHKKNRQKDVDGYIRYLSRKTVGKIDNSTLVSIRKTYNLAYGEDNNSEIIRELYDMNNGGKDIMFGDKIEGIKKDGISYMSDKYLSQLLNVAARKAEWMRLRSMKTVLDSLDEEEKSPDNILEYIAGCRGKKPKNDTVKECKKIIEYQLKHRGQRCQLVGREDILPMIHYIVQKKYEELYLKENRAYNMEEARGYFENAANAALSACGMAPISNKYRGDYLMLASFAKEDMYSLNDMIEILVQV